MKLLTRRLELVATTVDHLVAELESPEHLAVLLEAQVESGWPPGEYDRAAQEFFRDRMNEGGTDVIGWYGWYAIKRGDLDRPSVLVGAAGYFGPPSPEADVEIGFSIMPAWQGLGFASEIAEALVKRAFADPRVRRVIAHCVPSNTASHKVLEKCGFQFVRNEEHSGNDLFVLHPDISK